MADGITVKLGEPDNGALGVYANTMIESVFDLLPDDHDVVVIVTSPGLDCLASTMGPDVGRIAVTLLRNLLVSIDGDVNETLARLVSEATGN